MEKIKQIEKILEVIKKHSVNYPFGNAICESDFKSITSEIATLYEGWYPREFVDFLLSIGDMEGFMMDHKTKDNAFKWWQDNVEGK